MNEFREAIVRAYMRGWKDSETWPGGRDEYAEAAALYAMGAIVDRNMNVDRNMWPGGRDEYAEAAALYANKASPKTVDLFSILDEFRDAMPIGSTKMVVRDGTVVFHWEGYIGEQPREFNYCFTREHLERSREPEGSEGRRMAAKARSELGELWP